jgi:cobalt-zinc-cadmium efflux system membrane fusion protein
MRNKLKIYWIASCFFIAGTLLTGCKSKPATDPESAKFVISDNLQHAIVIDTVKNRQVVSQLNVTGKITFDEDNIAKIFPFAGGIVQNLKVELGDQVKKGQVLAVIRSIESADYANQLHQAESNADIAQKNAETAQSAFNSGLISQRELLTSQKELKKALSELDRIKTIVNIMGEDSGLSYTIKYPQTGFIVEKNATSNMEFRADNPNPLFTIANLDKVYVIANVFESDIDIVKLGYDAKITTLSYPGKEFEGKIDKIYNVIDPDTKVMKVRIKLKNPGILLKPDMFANIQIIYPEDKQLNYIPSSAVIFDKNNFFVMVYHSRDSVETRKVSVYKTHGPYSYISDGLSKDEKVISKKALLIYDALND